MTPAEAWVRLHGGNVTPVLRRGDTVLRVAGAWTPTVHAVMRHARRAGMAGIPEPRGVGERGELLEYIPGVVPAYPMPSWVWHDSVLDQAARMLRAWHDATAGFIPRGAVWRLAGHEPAEAVCHNDFAPHNLVFDGDEDRPRIVGVIDFDTMSPGPRVWDVAYLAYRLVPYLDETDDRSPGPARRNERLERLLSAYGAGFTRAELFATMSRRLIELADFSDGLAARDGRPELRLHARMYRDDAARVAREA